ncbi:MAG TPA: hypothetical protein VHX18_10720 [Rhizomicrobium sp.]|jgi:hypothetical protein|nr:hypothetical protein [Rhizomicrobium sp.]
MVSRFVARQVGFFHHVLLQPDGGADGNIGAIVAIVAAHRVPRGDEAGAQVIGQAVFQHLPARQAQFAAMPDQEPGDVGQPDIGARRHQDGMRAVEEFRQILPVPVQALGQRADHAQHPDFGIAAGEMPYRGPRLALDGDGFDLGPIGLGLCLCAKRKCNQRECKDGCFPHAIRRSYSPPG